MGKERKPVFLGVIPARGGSKGIRNKNLRKVLNKPLIYYTIKEALGYKELYKSIVSTDSPEIAKEAKKYGAEVPFIRPKKLARDDTPMLKTLKHALIKCEDLYPVKIQGVVLLDPTSPVRNRKDVKKMISIFLKKKPDLVIAVASSKRNPYFHMVKINKSGYAQNISKKSFVCRQEAPLIFNITNSCWVFSRRTILRGCRIPRKTIAYQTNGFYVDIDSEDDLKLFERFLRGSYV